MTVLAVDQGTTTTRALTTDPDGYPRIIKVIAHDQFYPRPGWVEHDPEALVSNILSCINACKTATIVGIANQGESCLAWDAVTKKAVTPVIVWQDDRTRSHIDTLKDQGSEALTLDRAGLPLDSYFSASKLGWIMSHIPEAKQLHKKGRLRLGTTDAFFLDRLTNTFATDVTTASRTSLMNLSTCQWDSSLCDLFGVPLSALPPIKASTENFGRIDLPGRQVRVTASMVDQQAALFGQGAKHMGDAKITFGTGVFALALTGDIPCLAPEKGLLPTAAWRFKGQNTVYALDGGVFSAGSAVNWARSLGLFSSFDQINSFDSEPAFLRDLVFVPALAGLGCPHWDRSGAGMWLGLCLDTTPQDMMQALLEGIVLRTAEVIREMNRLVAISDQIRIDGGLTANPYLCQFLADVLNRRVFLPDFSELTALGTARLAQGPGTLHPDLDGKEYLPQTDRSSYVDRFTQAVKRAAQWRGTQNFR